MTRTQDPDVSFIEYFAFITAMFRRYGEVAEDIKLSIISRNLAPFYTMQLPTVTTLSELESECLKLEVKKHRSDNYHPPSRSRRSYVEPDFAYINTVPSTSQPLETNQLSQAYANIDAVQSRTITCWNCQKPGQSMQQCSEPRKRLCYRCGTHGVTVQNCPKCNPGNGPRRTS